MALMHYNKAKDALNIASKQSSEQKEDAKLREQTDNFESLLLKTMLELAIKNDDTLYPKQPGSDIYHSMYIEQLSQSLSGSFGYSELLFNFLKEQQNMGLAKKGVKNPYGISKQPH
nr:rod-binding protein [Helicobacter jaachi]